MALRFSLGNVAAAAAPASIEVDGRGVAAHVIRAQLRFPAQPGPFSLVYPEWLPGQHAPTGRIQDLVDIAFRVGGRSIAWQRDDENMYELRCVLPAGTTRLDVDVAFVAGTGGRRDNLPAVASQRLWILEWNNVILYPKGADPKTYGFAASVRLPEGWNFACALPIAERRGDGARFSAVPLETLIDSPLAAGVHARTVDLTPAGGPPHELCLFGDSAEALAIKDAAIAGYRKLVTEARALFGGWPYRRYKFLLSLSEHVPHGGLEHHESSDNRVGERTLLDDNLWAVRAGLLPHELVHAWNGKLRRPAGLVVKDYQTPVKTDLLWVYEGLTSYLGETLTVRAGLRSMEESRDSLAHTAALLDARGGRRWRSLGDTATAAPMLSGASRAWRGWRRGLDYYPESQLVWLEADVIIRQRSNGARTLDEVCQRFFGAHARGAPAVVAYELPELLAALNAACPLDWAAFFRARIDAVLPRAPVGGIVESGWKLVYREAPSAFQKKLEQAGKEIDHSFSLGLVLHESGSITDVLPGGVAEKAGVAPLGTVIA
ncbi:MAG TPA: M61 family peptidase, partial [Polyangia bacterium]